METTTSEQFLLYGLSAEFSTIEELIAATKQAYEAGYRKMDAYSPLPSHELSDALHADDPRLPWLIFLAGVAGCVGGYLLQWWINVVDYPLNIGGKPFHSWPNFIPVAYECTILAAAGCAVVAMLALNGLPRPYHSIFNAPNFERASRDRFFLCIEAQDPRFDLNATREFLLSTSPLAVSEVEA